MLRESRSNWQWSCLDVGGARLRVLGGAATGPDFDPSERLATMSVLKLNLKKQQGTTTTSKVINRRGIILSLM